MFDEACEYILSMKTTKEVKENGKVYLKESWIKEPQWNDQIEKYKVNNNSSLISSMKENLKKYE